MKSLRCHMDIISEHPNSAGGRRASTDVRVGCVDAERGDCHLPRGLLLLPAHNSSKDCGAAAAVAAGGQFIVDLGAHTPNPTPPAAASSSSRRDSSNSRRSPRPFRAKG